MRCHSRGYNNVLQIKFPRKKNNSSHGKKVIGNEVKEYLKRQRLKVKDILGVAQICDLDTAYGQASLEISADRKFLHDTAIKKTYVADESQLKRMKDIYNAKVKNTQTLFSMGKISLKNTDIPYRLFYFDISQFYSSIFGNCSIKAVFTF